MCVCARVPIHGHMFVVSQKWVYMYMHTCEGQKLTSFSFLVTLHFIYQSESLGEPEIPLILALIANQLAQGPRLCLPSVRITVSCHAGFWGFELLF